MGNYGRGSAGNAWRASVRGLPGVKADHTMHERSCGCSPLARLSRLKPWALNPPLAPPLLLERGTVQRTRDSRPARRVETTPASLERGKGGRAVQLPMGSDEILFQGPIMLDRALFCLDCEVIFTGLAGCPSCSGRVIWPLAEWLSPAQPKLPVESGLVGCPPPSEPATEDTRVGSDSV